MEAHVCYSLQENLEDFHVVAGGNMYSVTCALGDKTEMQRSVQTSKSGHFQLRHACTVSIVSA